MHSILQASLDNLQKDLRELVMTKGTSAAFTAFFNHLQEQELLDMVHGMINSALELYDQPLTATITVQDDDGKEDFVDGTPYLQRMAYLYCMLYVNSCLTQVHVLLGDLFAAELYPFEGSPNQPGKPPLFKLYRMLRPFWNLCVGMPPSFEQPFIPLFEALES